MKTVRKNVIALTGVVMCLLLMNQGDRWTTALAQPTGLVAAYAFDEGAGTTTSDASGNSHNGTISNGTWTALGRFGAALQFNGASGGVTVSDAAALDLTGGMTLEAWVYPTSTVVGWRAVISKNTERYFLMAGSDNNRPVGGGTFTAGGTLNLRAPNVLPVNTWTHLAATYDGTNVRIFVNGVQAASQAQTGALTTSTGTLTIGYDAYGEVFAGRIDEVRVYNRALSGAEIQTDMISPVGIPGPPHLTITQPAAGAVISGTTVPVAYIASGDLTEVNHVHFTLDTLPEVMDLTLDGSYQFTNVATGPHVLNGYLVRADHSKIIGTDATPVNFSTTVPDTTPPTVSITAPAAGSTLSGVVTMAAVASDDVGVAGVQFKIDGGDAGAQDLTFPYSMPVNTATYLNGVHSITAVARDVAGNTTTSAPVSVTFSNTNPNDPAVIGQWAPSFSWPIVGLHAALLPTGKILTWSDTSATEVRLWNPATGTFASKPYSATNLFCSGQTFLADGRLLVVGGHLGVYVGATTSTIFDSWTEQWVAAGSMSSGRWYPTATTLGDGRVLAVSGAISCPTCLIPGDPHEGLADVAEIFNPPTNSWAELSNAPLRLPMYPHMFLLPNGGVLASSANVDPTASWVLDLGSQSWSLIPGGVLDGGSAAMYAPGKIIKSGTAWNPDYPIKNSDATTYVLDMTSPSPAWRQTPTMAFARTEHTLTLLPDGTVLATGGSRDSNVFDLVPAVYEAELWSPATETWKTMARMANPRMYHSVAILLPDARVITLGGGTFGIDQLNAQIYSPPYLFKGPRPVISSAPGTITHGSTFAVQTPDAARVSAVSLMGISSVTHAFNANQRYLPLTFQPRTGAVDVTLPSNQNLAPPGYYMLFLLDSNGVPSVSAMVRVTSPPDTTPPGAPGTLTATSSELQIGLSWGAATDNVGVTGYRVERCQGAGCGNFAQIATATGLSFTDVGLSATTSYSYRVRASDAVGLLGPYSNIASATTDVAPPQPPGMVAAYGFDEGAGTSASDASGNGRTGTLVSGSTWNPSGRFGAALQFNGTTGGVTVADAVPLDLTSGMTLEAWVYPTSTVVGWRAVISKNTERYFLMAGSDNNRPVGGGTFTAGGTLNLHASNVLPVNTWTHLAATFDGTSVRIFVNGVQVASQAQTGALTTSTGTLTIGYDAYGEVFGGRIDEVRVYNRALTAGEIQADMVAPVRP